DVPVKQLTINQLDSYSSYYKEVIRIDNISFDEHSFRQIIRQRVLDALFLLDIQAGGYYSFRDEVGVHDKDFGPSISPGQFLLDMVTFENNSAKFQQ
ncbi:hypothetical protein PTM75_14910, partial [Clostridium perfringens]|nr:hypothetical protein [Clostridium perfringens]